MTIFNNDFIFGLKEITEQDLIGEKKKRRNLNVKLEVSLINWLVDYKKITGLSMTEFTRDAILLRIKTRNIFLKIYNNELLTSEDKTFIFNTINKKF